MQLPKARTAELVEQETDKELLIYDLQTNIAYMLNETSKNVFRACAGMTSFDDLKRQYKYTDDLIYLTLDELKKNDLLIEDYVAPFAGIGRREVVRRVGLSTLAMLPVIVSLVAPQALHAASGMTCDTSFACQDSSQCPAPCTTCTGSGACENTSTACTNIGGSCNSTGTCQGADPANGILGTCSNSGDPCLDDSFCTVSGNCNGVGNCGT